MILFNFVQLYDNNLLCEVIECCQDGSQELFIIVLNVFNLNNLSHVSAWILILWTNSFNFK